jgi:ketosteroid isomerase-like protein
VKEHDMTALELAKAALKAYVDKDRDAIEALIAEDFRFTSPIDNALDRETYLRRCWPNSVSMESAVIKHAADLGEHAFIVYEVDARGKRFRNCELHTAREGRLVSVEVYFGWDLPHTAPWGSYVAQKGSTT